MALAHVISPLSLLYTGSCSGDRIAVPKLPCASKINGAASAFKTGSTLLQWKASSRRRYEGKAKPVSIRCDQATKDNNGLDVWLGRLAMVGFATAIGIEIATGKGLLENLGFAAPLPTLALAVTALVGVLTAVFIFQSATRE